MRHLRKTPDYVALWRRMRWFTWIAAPLIIFQIVSALTEGAQLSSWLVIAPPAVVAGQGIFYWWKSRQSTKAGLTLGG